MPYPCGLFRPPHYSVERRVLRAFAGEPQCRLSVHPLQVFQVLLHLVPLAIELPLSSARLLTTSRLLVATFGPTTCTFPVAAIVCTCCRLSFLGFTCLLATKSGIALLPADPLARLSGSLLNQA